MSTPLRCRAAGDTRAVVIGAGIGGLAAAIDLANAGLAVTVLEGQSRPGGKLRRVEVAGTIQDAGPTVLTMRHAFEALFTDSGAQLEDYLTLHPLERLARHAWADGGELDLYANPERSAEAIGDLAGAAEAHRFRAFCKRAREIHDTLDAPFMRAQRPNPITLTHRVGYRHLGALFRIQPFATLWRALGRYFHDTRLRQLYARYATYCGSSPFAAPATLMLIAHVEAQGVWRIEGGMHRLAEALASLAEARGVTIRYNCRVERLHTESRAISRAELQSGECIPAEIVVSNADAAALGAGLLGNAVRGSVPGQPPRVRSQSAMTWNYLAETEGFPLHHHTVFFSTDYADEFDAVFRRSEPPAEPTVYICAQDREEDHPPGGPERLLCLINAPARGNTRPFHATEIDQCQHRTLKLLERCGLSLHPRIEPLTTTPNELASLFPGTEGALYGMATHGWRATFQRPPARGRIPGLYLAGGSTHPGAGLPMAMISGRLAAEQALADLTSASRSQKVAMPGGTSTP